MMFLIYLWTRLDCIQDMSLAICLACWFITLLFFVLCFAIRDESSEVEQEIKRLCKKFCTIAIICDIVYLLVPSKKDIALAVVLPTIVKSEMVRKDFPEIVSLGVETLKLELLKIKEDLENDRKRRIISKTGN